ncbi:uncharacterized protein BCR38DRAFT_442641 [Pseudomassariella vexata]|uniref:Uncharacterized protein n=1 Tax=Pseudomassariella vexata TaxID=1141098 RepID=A0A1Y2DNK2_9PEZI|nr:uncharacterized protein BCR38DRAFT_442641 [Pseudomassariella vexata]ORY60830.1 hypothetical protein BCR38DRAFT_442641 [Pseudomassariella vexata]
MTTRSRNSLSKAPVRERIILDVSKLVNPANSLPTQDLAPNGSKATSHGARLSYEDLIRCQLNEDIMAYKYDLEFCEQQLSLPDLTAQETRTIQLRVLDCGHRIRDNQHRIQAMDIQKELYDSGTAHAHTSPINFTQRQPFSGLGFTSTNGGANGGAKRQRTSKVKPDNDEDVAELDADGTPTNSVSIQRLGFWKCRLCTSQKYQVAPPSTRVPSAPCKWPLKDVSKMLNHFLDMHTEQNPGDRCRELGDALDKNRGPFEYWMTRTRSQNLGDGLIIDEIIETLQAGSLPDTLRNLNRAAATFPNSVSGVKVHDVV